MIIIMGSVGSGKTEQTTRLANKLNIPRLSTSSLLREQGNPEFDKKIKAGDLVDDHEVIRLLSPELERVEADKKEFILDGTPRSITQAEWLVEKIKDGSVKLTAIIVLNVSDETVIKRMLNRGRDDDKEEIIQHRLDEYHAITNPVVDYLRNHDIQVHEVNGELSPDEVEQQIIKVLE